MSSAETGQMSAVETGQMSAAETGQMSSAETRQMSTGKTGRCPVSPFYICLVSAEDIFPVSAADIGPVSTADVCLVSTEDIWLLWGHLGRDENDFDPLFTPTWAKWSTPAETLEPRKWGHGPLLGAGFYTCRGLALREFSKQTPSNKKHCQTLFRWKTKL